MKKTVSFLGIAIAAAMLMLALFASPQGSQVQAHEDSAQNCPVKDVALDEGYGYARTEARRVCNAFYP